jgi:hypothetical protein
MSSALIALAAILFLGLTGIYFHMTNIDATYNSIMKLSGKSSSQNAQNSKDETKKEGKNKETKKIEFISLLKNQQGSTFDAIAISSWILFVVGIFCSFLLTPQLSDGLTFLKVPALASSSMGFLYFGIIALIIGGLAVIVLNLPRVYSMYIISRKVKAMIMATWLILLLPVSIPMYLTTIYPYPESLSDWINIAFICLVISQVLLLSPIYIKALGVKL